MKAIILIVFLFAIGISCESTVARKHGPLSENEIYEIINQGYYDYLDSTKQDPLLFNVFFEMRDSAYVTKTAKYLRTFNPNDRIAMNAEFVNSPVHYTSDKIKKDLIKNLTIVTKTQIDSIATNNHNWFEKPEYAVVNVTSISKPFRSAHSEIVIIEEYPVITFQSCFPAQLRYLFLQKINNRWKVVHII